MVVKHQATTTTNAAIDDGAFLGGERAWRRWQAARPLRRWRRFMVTWSRPSRLPHVVQRYGKFTPEGHATKRNRLLSRCSTNTDRSEKQLPITDRDRRVRAALSPRTCCARSTHTSDSPDHVTPRTATRCRSAVGRHGRAKRTRRRREARLRGLARRGVLAQDAVAVGDPVELAVVIDRRRRVGALFLCQRTCVSDTSPAAGLDGQRRAAPPTA